MNDRSTPTEFVTEDFYRSARPIRRFAVTLAFLAAALLLVWWTALLSPRLSLELAGGEFDFSTQRGRIAITVTNDAPTPIRLSEVRISPPVIDPSAATLDGTPLDELPELRGDSTATLVIEYQATNCPIQHSGPGVLMSLEAETIAGMSRTTPNRLALSPVGTGNERPC